MSMQDLRDECLKLCILTTGACSSKVTLQNRMRAHYREHTDGSVPGGATQQTETDSEGDAEEAAQIGEGGAEEIGGDAPDSVPNDDAVVAEAASVSPISFGVTPPSYGVEPKEWTSLFGSAAPLVAEPMVPPRPALPDANTILSGFPSETGSGLQEHVAGNPPAPSATDAAAAEAPTAPLPPAVDVAATASMRAPPDNELDADAREMRALSRVIHRGLFIDASSI